MTTVYDPMTGLALGSSPVDNSMAHDNAKAGINALLQEDVAAEVLQHFTTRQKLQLASVCRVWRACVAKSWSSVELTGPGVQKQLAWLAQHVEPHMPKILAVSGGTAGSHVLVDVAPSVQPFTALRCLCLTPIGGVTPACIAALSSLQHLASLATDIGVPSNSGSPLDLAEYALLTGLRELVVGMIGGGADIVLSRKWAALKHLTYLEISGVRQLGQELGPFEGALHTLFQHLRQVNLQVFGAADLVLVSPSLESLMLSCAEALPSTCSASFPRMLALTTNCESIHKGFFEGLPLLESLTIGGRCTVDAASLASLSGRSSLRSIRIVGYSVLHNAAALEEFAGLPLLEDLDLKIDVTTGSYTISEHLSGLKRLSCLILGSSRDATYGGGIEHLPALRTLALPGICASGAALKSTALTFLETRGLHGRGVNPDKHMRLGFLPMLRSYHAQDLLELTPAVLHDINSLQALQVLEVSICYNAAAGDPMKTYSPENGGDVTSLLQNLSSLPSLRAARITALRRSVGPVSMCCLSHLKHLALACTELALSSAGSWDPIMGPISLHIIAERASPETVAVLQRMKAELSTLWTGELYMTKRLQQWKAGPPHALDLHPRTAMASMETVYDGGFFL